ncbi:34049_t:CDS:2, partial [Racocetra persica]
TLLENMRPMIDEDKIIKDLIKDAEKMELESTKKELKNGNIPKNIVESRLKVVLWIIDHINKEKTKIDKKKSIEEIEEKKSIEEIEEKKSIEEIEEKK